MFLFIQFIIPFFLPDLEKQYSVVWHKFLFRIEKLKPSSNLTVSYSYNFVEIQKNKNKFWKKKF